MNKPDIPRRVYGRRLGRPLNESRQKALDTLLPQLSFSDDFLKKEPGSVKPNCLFKDNIEEIWIEIGFGDGEHLNQLMKRHPQHGFIGAEPFINGMSGFLKSLLEEKMNLDHIRVHMDDAISLLEKLSDQSIDRIYILNPDPWPKARHFKRRIINPQNLDLFARILKPSGQLIMTTDVDDLAEWMVTQASNHPDFFWTAKSATSWKEIPKDWIQTKYELKGKKAGRKQTYLFFLRL